MRPITALLRSPSHRLPAPTPPAGRRPQALPVLLGLLAMTATLVVGTGPAASAATPGASSAASAGPVAALQFDAQPLANPAGLGPGGLVTVEVQALDGSGSPVADASIYLSLTSTAAVVGTASVGDSALTAQPQRFVADRDGRVGIAYETATPQCAPDGTCIPAGYPLSGTDTINAASTSGQSPVTASTSYSYGPGASAGSPYRYVFSPDPLASPGSLHGGDSIPVSLTVTDSAGVPQAQSSVALSFSSTAGAGASATGCGPLSSTPTICTTDAQGVVSITYTTAAGTAPTSGQDVIQAGPPGAGSAGSPGGSSGSTSDTYDSDTYDYAAPSYSFDTVPLASSGSLGSAEAKVVRLTVTDSSGTPLAETPVYLLLATSRDTTAAGSAYATGAFSSDANPTGDSNLSVTPRPFDTDTQGRILITYTTPDNPPGSGTDALIAQNRAASPTAQGFEAYTFAPPTPSFSPSPLAAAGSLPAGHSVSVRVSGSGSVYLSFWSADGGGTASVNGQALTETPQAFSVGAGGLGVTYQTPATLPKTGQDLIVVQDAASSPVHLAADRYSFAPDKSTGASGGYVLAGSDGSVYAFGGAPHPGDLSSQHLAAPIVGMAATPDGGGYWLVARDGGIFTFGDAHFYGSTGAEHLNQPIVGMAATPDGGGYWLAAADGGIFSFGDAPFRGSEGGARLNRPVVGIAPTATGLGYWLVASDGGIFTFGDAAFFGSAGSEHLVAPIVGMAATANAAGYWFVAADGGVFSYGNATFSGSEGGKLLPGPVVTMAAG